MKNAKRIAAMCVAAALAASNVMVITSSAADQVKVSVSASETDLKTGDEVVVAVTLSDNPGIVSWRVALGYDETAFELEQVIPVEVPAVEKEEGESGADYKARKEEIQKPYIELNESTLAYNYLQYLPVNTESNPVTVGWANATAPSEYEEGVIAQFTFKVKDTAEPKEYEFELTAPDVNDFFDFDMNKVEPVLTGAKVSVTVEATGVEADPATLTFEGKNAEPQTITAKVTPEAASQKVTFTSSDTSIATVDADGKVTPVAEGECKITVSTDNGKTAEVSVKVNHKHVLKKVEAVAPTCTAEGNNEYYVCEDCGDAFKDEAGTEATTVEAETLAKIPHDFSNEDASEKYLKTAANCVSAAEYYKSCTVCGEAGTETFFFGEKDPTNHVGETEVRDAVPATVQSEGYTGDTYCKSCGEKIKDGEVIPKLVLVKIEAKDPTHEEEGNIEYYVTEAGDKYYKDAEGNEEISLEDTVIAKVPYDFAEEWSSDDTYHWHNCKDGCGAREGLAEHEFEVVDFKEATETETGYIKNVCKVCGHEYEEEIPVLTPVDSEDESEDESEADSETESQAEPTESTPAPATDSQSAGQGDTPKSTDSATSSKTDGDNGGKNANTGARAAASVFAVATAIGLGALVVSKKRK